MSQRTDTAGGRQDWREYAKRIAEEAPPFSPEVMARLRGLYGEMRRKTR